MSVCYHGYLTVKYKFGLPDATELDAFDETNTIVEEDIFSELIEASPDLCLTVRDRFPDAGRYISVINKSLILVDIKQILVKLPSVKRNLSYFDIHWNMTINQSGKRPFGISICLYYFMS